MNEAKEEMSGIGEGEKSEDVAEVMKTPEKSKSVHIATSVSKLEESPIFNFLSNLSPIKPVKRAHVSQSISPLSFPSLSMFSSQESPQRRNLPDDPSSKPEFSSVEESKDYGVDEMNGNEYLLPRMPDGDMAVDSSRNRSMFTDESEKEYGCSNNPTSTKNHSPIPFFDDSMALVPLQRISHGNEPNMNSAYHGDRNEEFPQCDWDSLIGMSDLLEVHSPSAIDSCKKSVDLFKYRIEEDDLVRMQSQCVEQVDSEGNDSPDDAENNECYTGPSMNNHVEKKDDKVKNGFQRGNRRRCLVFEMKRPLMKHLNEAQEYSSVLPQSQSSALPVIGLHLNAIASSMPKEYNKIANQDSSASRRLSIGPNSSVSFRTGREPQSEKANSENCVEEDAQQAPGNEEANSHGEKKKRRREQTDEACKRCTCKKSKCLKLYCECFAAGIYCVEPCACIDCFNKPIHEDIVLATRKQIESRNPLAFAPKVIRGSDSSSEIVDDVFAGTPASARHKRGCNCKKSGCLKKYCECYQAGVGCSINCRCEGCKNAFGIKNGVMMNMELEVEEDELPPTPRRQSMMMMMMIPRPLLSWTNTINNKPPQSSSSIVVPSMMNMIGGSSSSSSSYTNNSVVCYDEKNPSNFFDVPTPKLIHNKHFDAIVRGAGNDENNIPHFLVENSPICRIKSSSPNGKRVSPPHHNNVGVRPSSKRLSFGLMID